MDAPVMVNLILILTLVVIALLIFLLGMRNKNVAERTDDSDEERFTLPAITDWIKNTLNDITNENLHDLGLSTEEFRRRAAKRAKLKQALKECSEGDVRQKNYVKSYIYDLLWSDYNFSEETINIPVPFLEKKLLTAADKFDILMFKLQKKYKYNALNYIIEKYELAKPKYIIEEGKTASYIITSEEIDQVYRKEVKNLSYEDKLWIIVQKVYQRYKGLGVVDEIRDMNIDGISGGVNGLPSSAVLFGEDGDLYTEQMDGASIPNDYDSVWIFYRGKSIHLSFLSFGSETELNRVCHNIYKYNMPGPLTDENGFKINEMKDGSRVVVVRPSFAESYAFFVRKFDIPNANLDMLFPNDKVRNSNMVKLMLIFLMKGRRVTAVTGAQGSGKTTLMMAMVKYFSATLNIRVHELAFELHLRKIFPFRNILSFRETDTVSSQQGLDLQKKTDGSVTLLGEMAEMKTASQVIQTSEVASEFTVFTGHQNTVRALINYMSNALVKIDGFSNDKAEEQVVNVLDFNIHLRRRQNGFRHLERITEIIPLTDKSEYIDYQIEDGSTNDTLKALLKTFKDFAERMTDRKTYEYRDIIKYESGRYIWVNPITTRNVDEMKENMSENEIAAFDTFLSICESLHGCDWDEINRNQEPFTLLNQMDDAVGSEIP